MSNEGTELCIRRAIGGDTGAVDWIVAQAETTDDAVVITMAALIEQNPARLSRAEVVAATHRDRQVVAIARAHLGGDDELVDALARDHLVNTPDSLIVAWMAADSLARAVRRRPR